MPQLSVTPNDKITYKLSHEDQHVLVVGKPARIVSVPGLGHDRSSLLNALFVRYGPRLQQLGKDRAYGMLHRLDRDTSGLLMVALTKDAYDHLRGQFERREVAKFYWALCHGAPKKPEGVVRLPISEFQAKVPGEHGTKKLARVGSSGEEAVTAYRVVAQGMGCSLMECRAITGKLHQVRVHLESLGCPILGDSFYAPASVRDMAPRLCLHAHRLAFTHPATGERIDVRSTWPDDLRGTLKRLGIAKPSASAS